ncbi:DNA internalization-related competence protein ComEC/Rec2 [Melioribacteraceae bacterium 4301-Me]|uniref:DNA internalization-related competence protein ComEC/Rec2 n=1 Tax=Pyranulibacter aquaticus TaxID=3163344 RepID=UPI00359798BA
MKDYPLIKFVLFFILGILVGYFFNIRLTYIAFASLLLLIINAAVNFTNFTLGEIFKNILLLSNIVLIGACYYLAISNASAYYPFSDKKIYDTELIGKVESLELLQNDRFSFELNVEATQFNNFKSTKKYLSIVNVYDSHNKLNKLVNVLKPGNKIKVKGTLTEPRGQRNPGEFDYRRYLNDKGIASILSTYNTSNLLIIDSSKSIFKSIVYEIRLRINNRIKKLYDSTTAGLIKSLLLADKKEISFSDKGNFINAGVMHVLAVSGLHVGYILLIFLFLLSRINIYLRYIFTILGLVVFLIITNSPPSVFRAVVMAVIFIISVMTNRNYNGYNALALSALVVLLIKPTELFNAGFQLSFLAVLSILYFYPLFNNTINRLNVKSNMLKSLLLFISVSIAAQVGTLPITIIYFQKLSLIAIFTNLIVIPLVGIIVGLAILSLAVSYLSFGVALVYASVTNFLSSFLFWIINKTGSIKYSHLYLNHFSNLDLFFYFISLLFLVIFFKKFSSLKSKIILCFLVIVNYAAFSTLDDNSFLAKNKLTIVAIDVGQGDSFLIKFPNGTSALIDAGNSTSSYDNGMRTIYPLIKYLDIDTINYAFISHVDADHYAGFLSLFNTGIVKKVYKPLLDSSLSKDVQLEKYLHQLNLPVRYYEKSILRVGNTRIYILNDFYTNKYFSENDRSGFLKIAYGNNSFLFTGDAGLKVEDYYINRYRDFLKSDLLKVGHHGSKTSTGDYFLKTVIPKYALISVGIKNKFNHPSREVINRLISNKIKVFRTDLNGAVVFESDGQTITEVNWKKRTSNFILE